MPRQRIDLLTGNPAAAHRSRGENRAARRRRHLPYDRLLLATGALPRPLPGLPRHQPAYRVTLRTFDDAVAIRARLCAGRRIAIIGGGFIGLELAATARKLGAEVTVIEAQPRILMRGVPAEIAGVVAARHRAEGVEILCGAGIDSIADETRRASKSSLPTADTIDADLALIGIGAIPDTHWPRLPA